MRREPSIMFFKDDYEFLSNFYPAEVRYEGLIFPTVEHGYQAAKSLLPNVRKHFAQIKFPGQAKKVGQTVTLRPDWDTKRLEVMRELLEQKFAPSTELAKLLLETGTRGLVEGNTWNDDYWGMVFIRDEGGKVSWRGLNHLGMMLMQIRSGLRVTGVDKRVNGATLFST